MSSNTSRTVTRTTTRKTNKSNLLVPRRLFKMDRGMPCILQAGHVLEESWIVQLEGSVRGIEELWAKASV